MSDQFFMLVRRGAVQRMVVAIGGKPSVVWPVAKSHRDAKQLCQKINIKGIVPAQIGSMDGETLEGHIAMAMSEGCIGICCVNGWNADGSPNWGLMMFPENGGEPC